MNDTIILIINLFLKVYPEIRFNQAIYILNIIKKDEDSFYLEPEDAIKRSLSGVVKLINEGISEEMYKTHATFRMYRAMIISKLESMNLVKKVGNKIEII